jgi:hypothetical protein
MTPNPPWVDALLRKHGAALAACAGQPLPSPVGRKYKELGCGHYGCVLALPTEGLVLKITSDPSEAAFVAAYLQIGHQHPGIVRYDRIVELPETYRRRRTFAIWRQEAANVGKFATDELHERYWKKYSSSMVEFVRNLTLFKRQAEPVRAVVRASSNPERLLADAAKLEDWAWKSIADGHYLGAHRTSAQLVAYKRRQLEMIAEYMASTHAGYLVGQAFDFYLEHGLLLADVHLGNIGEVTPHDFSSWEIVVTDPGHMVPLDPKWLSVRIPQL